MIDLKKELDNLPNESIILILVNAIKYTETNLKILKILINEKKLSGIYITVNRSCTNLKTLLKNHGIDVNKLFFIDVITKTERNEPKRVGNCLFVSSPENLTEVSLALSQMVKAVPNNRFLFLDSISTFLIYNQMGTVIKFAHFLITKIREWKMMGVFVSLEKETDENLISQLTHFSDKVIVVDEVKKW